MLTNIERGRRYITKCQPSISGQRGHDAAFHAACVLVNGFALGERGRAGVVAGMESVLPAAMERIRLDPQNQIGSEHGSPFAAGYLLKGRHLIRPAAHLLPIRCGEGVPPKPKFQKTVLARIANKVADIKDVIGFLAERSPVPVDRQDSASVLRHLYPRGSGEKVLVFTDMKSQGQFLWEAEQSDGIQQRHLPAGNDGVWFLPQPVSGEFLPNPRIDGKLSRRSEEAITAWRYAVLESDEADADDWLRCLVQMPFRIASICESGGRSIHALVRLDAASKADWDRLMLTNQADAGHARR